MTTPRRAVLLLCLLTSHVCCVVDCRAADTLAPSDVEAAKASVQNIRTSSLEPLRRVIITKGTNELQLMAPQELSIDTSAPDKITFAARDLSYYVSVRIIATQSGGAKAETVRSDSNWVLENYSGANVIEEFSLPTGEGDCKLFNFTWPISGLVNRVGRVGLIQTSTGVVEFVMLADPQQAKAAFDDFHAVLCSLQTNARGPIKIPPVPDHS